jgi:hypothetical protein
VLSPEDRKVFRWGAPACAPSQTHPIQKCESRKTVIRIFLLHRKNYVTLQGNYKQNTQMKQLTVQVADNQYPFFMELLKRFDFVSYKSEEEITLEEDSEEDIEKNLKQGFKELNLVLQGKLKARPARELLHEL